MRTYKEFEIEISEREQLLLNILSHRRDFDFLSTPPSADMIKFLSAYPLFARSKNALFKLLCIEVNKLYSDSNSDHFRLTKLFDNIRAERKKAEWSDDLSKVKVKELQKLLDEALQNESLPALKKYRNKYLAHTDKDRGDASFFLKNLYRLIDIAVEIINELRSFVLKKTFPLQLYMEADGFNELVILSKK